MWFKRFASITVALLFILTQLTVFAQAALEWDATTDCLLAHQYTDGNAVCNISIGGRSSETVIYNVDVRFQRKLGASYITVAAWNDLSSGQYFEFCEIVENVEQNAIYRLSFTAEVELNGAVDYLNFYLDVDYLTNQRVS